MACSSVVLVLGDRPESWTFCTTFKYVFLDLDNCPVEFPPMITLISLSGGHDNSSTFPFNFSSLWSRPRKFLNFPCQMGFSICCFKSKHSSVSCHGFCGRDNTCSYCARWDLPSFFPATSRKDCPWLAWELFQAACSRAYIADSFLKTNLLSYCLNPSSLLFWPSLDEVPAQNDVGDPLLCALLFFSSWLLLHPLHSWNFGPNGRVQPWFEAFARRVYG